MYIANEKGLLNEDETYGFGKDGSSNRRWKDVVTSGPKMDLDTLVFSLTTTAAMRWNSYAALQYKIYANRDRRRGTFDLSQCVNENRDCVEIMVRTLDFGI